MKIEINNLGILKKAEYDLADLTIICGENNTGKTYATYILYAFFDFWQNGYYFDVDDAIIDKLFEAGAVNISISNFSDKANNILEDACLQLKKYLPAIFATNQDKFKDTKIKITIEKNEIKLLNEFNRTLNFSDTDILQITKKSEKDELSISFIYRTKEILNSSTREIIKKQISDSIISIVFTNVIPFIQILSAERTGTGIFKADLSNSVHHRLISRITSSQQLNINELINEFYNSPYSLPINRNIAFISKLEDIERSNSFIKNEHPDILSDFSTLLGGDFKISNNILSFIPQKTKGLKLSLGESSSSVRSLLILSFYLKHLAQKGDLLMIDEPELNLHPKNQRKLAKLLARLVNIGIKVFVTTHSDYIIKELNTLIMFHHNKEDEFIIELMNKYNYKEDELIEPDKIKVYISCYELMKVDGNTRKVSVPTLKKAVIDDYYGIEAESFDKTIDEMNKIQKSIILGK